MRIFIASGIFEPEPGGPATYLKHLLPELLTRGHDVTALTFGEGPVDGYPFPLTRIPRRLYPLRQWDYYRAAARLWPGHDIAYVHHIGLPMPPGVRPSVAKIVGDPAWERAMNRGWIAPDTDIDEFQSRRYDVRVEFNKMARARLAQRFDHIIVPSAYLKRLVVNWGISPARVSVVYNALQVPADVPQVAQEEARRRLNLPGGPLLFTAARMTPWKGIDHSIEALAGLPDVHLVIAGDGEERQALEAVASRTNVLDRVIFLGRVPREQIPLYYRAADYTILYSGYEGLSHVLLESLYVGTPLLASDKGGNPEVVRHGVNGLLIPYTGVEAIIEVVKQAFEPGQRARLASHSSDDLGRFVWSKLVDQTIAILEGVLESTQE